MSKREWELNLASRKIFMVYTQQEADSVSLDYRPRYHETERLDGQQNRKRVLSNRSDLMLTLRSMTIFFYSFHPFDTIENFTISVSSYPIIFVLALRFYHPSVSLSLLFLVLVIAT